MRPNSSACVDGAWISIVPLHLRTGRFGARLEKSPQSSRASTVVFRYRLRFWRRTASGGASPADVLTPAIALWIGRYGVASELESFSRNKLALFLHREFVPDSASCSNVSRSRSPL
jgi:hypothetical protein